MFNLFQLTEEQKREALMMLHSLTASAQHKSERLVAAFERLADATERIADSLERDEVGSPGEDD